MSSLLGVLSTDYMGIEPAISSKKEIFLAVSCNLQLKQKVAAKIVAGRPRKTVARRPKPWPAARNVDHRRPVIRRRGPSRGIFGNYIRLSAQNLQPVDLVGHIPASEA